MSSLKEERIQELEKIIRALADVWPADRDNVAVAGAQFEEFISTFEDDPGQLQRLIDVAWKGLRYLYEEDEFFMSVKTSTMQAVNTIREYLVEDGDIEVEVFEKAYDDLDEALSGGKESADTLIELEEEQAAEDVDDEKETKPRTLNDLASYILGLNEEDVSEEYVEKLSALIEGVKGNIPDEAMPLLDKAQDIVDQLKSGDAEEGWLAKLADLTEKAIEVESDEQWNESTEEVEQAEAAETGSEQEEKTEEVFTVPESIDGAMVGEFVTECTELLEMAEGALLDLEESPDDEELVNKVFRAFHTIKGTSAFMGLQPISEFTHHLETVLSMVRDGDIDFDTACADISLEAIDIINSMLDVIETSEGGETFPKPLNYERLTSVLEHIADAEVAPEKALEEAGGIQYETPTEVETKQGAGSSDDGATVKAAPNSSDDSQTESSVRVNVSRLDQLIDMIGELVIAHSVVAQDESIPDHSNLQKKINHTSKILRELQDTSLTLRMVPLKATFHKMNRLVRDLARKASKDVKLKTFGEDTEIDRNMVDIINEPLVHMVRNAIDHGIETKEERAKTDKPDQATVWLRASQEGGKVVIEIEDDGKGINKEKVLEKAINKGLVEPDQNLTDKEIYNLIFLPGFSSTDQVTDLSGRGVGMDVVRKSIEELKGKVDVESEIGEGTKITIELPFTLAITDGMLVRVGNQRFIVPTLNIDRAFRAQKDDVFTVMGNSEKVSIRGETVPVIRLHDHFNIDEGKKSLTDGTLLAIRNANKKYALLVDEVIGQQQLVGKSINMVAEMNHISGGAILGDGTVGLILDTAALMMN
ncbi:chemotaxis protein CheA [Fodinibius halophilus]|uniref:Chemotaxis protein CheA n=1 Tax=Fodinibius halophilus TaxID=1736908 RepID=A0A6M1T5Z7_9BACT|nr:chemotaxis protein CheA [Fodinibius halophilus]NGP87421.1 chemotaxis protein CheA [Fodinibius halophilus]